MNPLNRCATILVGFVVFPVVISSLGTLFAQDEKKAPQIPAPAYKNLPLVGQPPEGERKAETPKPGEQPKEPGKPDAKPGAKTEKKVAEPGRPRRKPQAPADPAELNAKPDDTGKISFSFKGQDWEDVLEWLADVSGLSLQMEEVPPGFFSLTTRGRYSVNQVVDLCNATLLGKGFTLLRDGEVLLVVKLEKMDKSLVPRVHPNELDERGTYEFVKCILELSSLVAESTAEELKPILSPHATITALKTTNRLDVLETAGNLRRIRDFLADEQSDRGRENLVREFKLRFVRATDALETLNTLLGLKSAKAAAAAPQPQMNPEQMAMMQQQQMAMMGGQPGQPPGGPHGAGAKGDSKIFLAINKRENSILANAPPDKMSIIEQAVKAMDLPQNKSESILANLPRLRTYHVTAVDPAALVKVLEDLAGLDPQTRLEVDDRSKSIIAFATPFDHVTIQAMVTKIDGTGRKFEVIQLHVLDAEMAAGSIEYLMKGPPEEKSNSNNRSYFYDFGYQPPSRSQQKESGGQMQVEPDTERNRLLIRATDVELAEIRQLLVKLGELPAADRSSRTVRVVPTTPGDTQKLLDRLKNAWPTIAPNPLKIDANGASEPGSDEDRPDPPRSRSLDLRKTDSTRSGRNDRAIANVSNGVALAEADVAEFVDEAPAQTPPPVNLPAREAGDDESLRPRPQRPGSRDMPAEPPPIAVSVGPNGLVISSQDTEALDRLEELLAQISPQRITSKLYYLKHTLAKDVAYLLEDVFKEDGASKKPPILDDGYWYYRFGPGSRSDDKARGRLSKRKQLKFIHDSVTNTILVQNADPAQLVEIERLIELYDEGVRPDSNSVRVTKQLYFRYTTAREVAEVIKDVFRDLLSPNDKSMVKAGPQQPQDQGRSMYGNTYIFGDGDKDNARKFKGLLSMGVDDRSNTLTVSAPKDLMTIIGEMADELDTAAGRSRGVVDVVRLGGPIDTNGLQKALSTMGKTGPNTNGQATGESGAKPAGPPPGVIQAVPPQ